MRVEGNVRGKRTNKRQDPRTKGRAQEDPFAISKQLVQESEERYVYEQGPQ